MTMFDSVHAFIARLNADKLKATPHVVPQPGLLRSVMGDDAFLAALDERRRWIAAYCTGSFTIGDLRDERGNVSGRIYCFSQYTDGTYFRFRF